METTQCFISVANRKGQQHDMKSDEDLLQCLTEQSVIMDLPDWGPGKINLLIIRNDRSPPQHCCLQMFRDDRPLPLTLDMVPAEVDVERDIAGRVLLKNTWMMYFGRELFGRYFIKQGPSKSCKKDLAYFCNTTPPECQTLFTRPKHGHWPRPDTLTTARQCGIFLVPQGHAQSDQTKLEWRFSTALIERLLMFDLCIVKIQVYTLLKVLRKSFFKPLVGDRLSTFHFKTALLFTVETYPPEIWQEHNLLQCVIYCLKTLQQWFNLRHCPHYTISGVDLFLGKLRKWEFPLLSAVLSDMIDNIMDFVSWIEMDAIGERIDDGLIAVSTRHQNMLHCFCHYIFAIFASYMNRMENMEDIFELGNIIMKVREILPLSIIRVELMHTIKFLYQLLASCSASIYLQRKQPISMDIYRLYEASLDSDLTSSRLKLASMLYCSGQYEKAEVVLSHTEEILHADMWQFCPCKRGAINDPTERFKERAFELPELEVMKSHVAYSIVFNSFEICCMPAFLLFEMMRTIGPENVQHRHALLDNRMGLAIIDAIPFLYYMQYLTFRQLGEQARKLAALTKLFNYVSVESGCCRHIETALHVLGHCYELEHELPIALIWYKTSLRISPHNNAARWHIMRLLSQGFQ